MADYEPFMRGSLKTAQYEIGTNALLLCTSNEKYRPGSQLLLFFGMKYFYLKAFFVCLSILFCSLFGAAQIKPSKASLDSIDKERLEGFQKKINFSDKAKLVSSKKKMVGDSVKKNKPVDLSNIVLENSAFVTGSGLTFRDPKAMKNFSIFGQVKVFGFPLAIDFANNSDEFERLDPMSDGLFKMNFDRSQYQRLYKNDLEKFSRFKKNVTTNTVLGAVNAVAGIGMGVKDIAVYGYKAATGKVSPKADAINAYKSTKAGITTFVSQPIGKIAQDVFDSATSPEAYGAAIGALSGDAGKGLFSISKINFSGLGGTFLSMKQKSQLF